MTPEGEMDAGDACDCLEKIREVLLIGLAAYGEIERLEDAQETEELRGNEIPKNARVIGIGVPENVSDFAAALMNVDILKREIRGWAEARQAPENHEALPPSP